MTKFVINQYIYKKFSIMKIKDLPQEIKELALLRQKEAGNEVNEEADLNYGDESFKWDKTPEGGFFWNAIHEVNFKPFYELYPQPNPLTEHLKSLGYTVTELARHFNAKYPLLFCTKGEKSVFVAKYEPSIHTELSLFLTKLVAENVDACILDSEFNPMFGGIEP
jgi:hypothetical protein